MTHAKIAVIGGGIAGIACARQLVGAGNAVRVFEKSRGMGGRMATRRMATPLGEARLDHGAQYFTARDLAFKAVVEARISAGDVVGWTTAIAGKPDPNADARYVGAPAMNAFPKALAQGLNTRLNARVQTIAHEGSGWLLDIADDGEIGPFDAVVVAVPAEQAAPLLRPVNDHLAQEAQCACTAPCWSLLAVYDREFDAPFDAATITEPGPIAWVSRQNAKPGRAGPNAWVAHAHAQWSRENLERSADDVAEDLQRAFRALMPAADAPILVQAHRWRYAQVESPAGTPFGWDQSFKIGTCGDWRLGPRVELAWASGDQLGQEMAKALATET